MRPVINGYLSGSHLVDYFSKKPNVVCNKAYFKGHRFRPDIILVDDKIIVEVDGYRHYTNPGTVMSDQDRDEITSELGFKTIRIPYWLQMTEKLWEAFGLNVNKYNDLPVFNYISGFVDTEVFPAHFCELGLNRYDDEVTWLIESDCGIHYHHAVGTLSWQLARHHPQALQNLNQWLSEEKELDDDQSDGHKVMDISKNSLNTGMNVKLNDIQTTISENKIHCYDRIDELMDVAFIIENRWMHAESIAESMQIFDHLIHANRVSIVDDFSRQELLVLGKMQCMSEELTEKVLNYVENSKNKQLFKCATI